MNWTLVALIICASITGVQLSDAQTRDILDSGGVLSPEQASYDVTYYALDIAVDPDEQSLRGRLVMSAKVVQPLHKLVLDLDTMLAVSSVAELDMADIRGKGVVLRFEREAGELRIDLMRTRQPGERIRVVVDYAGKPRVAPRAPWDGGFTWSSTPSGEHWVATTCQTEGADLWWPCKDHVSDEPDSMDLYVTVPEPLVAACNGVLRSVDTTVAGRRYHWHISQPINIYNVALNIAPYELIETEYSSISGETFPFQFYVLREDLERGKALFPELQEHLRWFEELLGPYPFRGDKYGVAQTPHLGMEHQSIIAYGANFDNGSMTGGVDWGFDALHHHELAHEWWGNVITNASWEDMWIHEGFGSYMQALYCEDLGGEERYYNFMQRARRFANTLAIAPRQTKTSNEIYKAPIYAKGAWVLHTLRYYVGDDAFFEILRKMIYPSPDHAAATDGSQCRFVTSADFQMIAEEISGKDLQWFFETYLRQPALPVLTKQRSEQQTTLTWFNPAGVEFPMPVEVNVGGELRTVEIPTTGKAVVLEGTSDSEVVVDPFRRILCEIRE